MMELVCCNTKGPFLMLHSNRQNTQALYKAGLTGCVKGVKSSWSQGLRLFAHDAKVRQVELLHGDASMFSQIAHSQSVA